MTAEEFATQVNNGSAPWINNNWSDSTKEQYFNLLNTDTANAMELERWRLNNEYNSPRNQMIRMIEAGINPAFAYQQLSPGNSSSVPGTHKADSAKWHDTQDKLDMVNTIMNGISSIMGTISSGVGAVAGIQGIALKHQNNWFDSFRSQTFKSQGLPVLLTADTLKAQNLDPSNFVEVYPGMYTTGNMAQIFPEFFDGLGFKSGSYQLQKGGLDIQKQLADRRTRIDGLLQDIFQGIDNHESGDSLLKKFLQLFMYSLISRFGGGY